MHAAQHVVGDVLRRHLQFAADVIFTQLFHEGAAVFIGHQIIEPYAGADEYFLYARQAPELPQQIYELAVVYFQIRAGLWI